MTGARPLLPSSLQQSPGQASPAPSASQQQPHAGQATESGASHGGGSGDGQSSGGGGGSTGGGPGGGDDGSGSGSRPQYSKRGKITIVACVPCRKRKTKCDGKRPLCSQCASRDSQCHYDMTDDQRKLTYLRDNVELLQEKSSVLEGLLHTIQSANEEEAAEIFRRLRAGSSVQHVAEQVQAGRLLSGVGRGASARAGAPAAHDRTGAPPSGDPELTRARQYDILMAQLADSTPHDTSDVLRRIRHGEDVATILDAIQSGTLPPLRLVRSSPAENQVTLESDFSNQEQTFGIVKGTSLTRTHASSGYGAEFTDANIRDQWTEVTSDADLVEHLLTQYFTWQHSFFQNFPEDLFRSDFDTGRTKYCSSMLVNAICAAACFLADPDIVREHDQNLGQLTEKFYSAAIGQLQLDSSSCVTTTAALFLISYIEGTRGRLSSLWMYSGRSSLMAMDIDLHLKRAFKHVDDPDQRHESFKESKARCHAFWGAFHVDQITSFTLGRLPNINARGVTQEPPPIHQDEDQQSWNPSEADIEPRRPSAKSSTFAYCASLSKTVNGTLLMFFAPLVPLSGSLLIDEYEKYRVWYKTLPDILSATKNAPPHVLCLHMYYWVAVLHLFRPFLKASIHNSDVVPREICRSAANNISDIMSEHMRQYQWRGVYMFQVHCLLSACTIHIINIPSIQATRHFTEACNIFQRLLSRNEWARSCLGILRGLVETWNLILPHEAEEALCRDQLSREDLARTKPSKASPKLCHATDPSTVFDEKPHPFASPAVRSALRSRPPPSENVGVTSPSAKRSSSSTSGDRSGSPVSVPRPLSQKRQRMMAPNHPSSSGSHSDTQGGDASGGHIVIGPPAAENYLYSPVAGHPAPLLTPVQSKPSPTISAGSVQTAQDLRKVHLVPPEVRSSGQSSTTSSRLSFRDRTASPQVPQQQEEAHSKASDAEITAVISGLGAARPVSPPAITTGAEEAEQAAASQPPAESKRGDDEPQKPTQLDGITFGDDWRDPFMGFLGMHQEE